MVTGTTEPVEDETSTPEPPSAFMNTAHNLTESNFPGKNETMTKKILTESPRRRKIEVQPVYLYWVPWQKNSENENSTDCGLDFCFYGGSLDCSALLLDQVCVENRSQQIIDAGNP